MPLVSIQPKNPLLQTTAPLAKTPTVDDYFFRSLAEDLKRIGSDKPLSPKPLTMAPTKQPKARLPEIKPAPPTRPPLSTIPSPAPIAPPIKKPEPQPELKTIKPKTPVEIERQPQISEKQKQASTTLAAKKEQELARIEQEKKEQLFKIAQKQARVIFKQAKQAYRQKNLEQAISLCQQSLKLKPDFNKAKKYLNKAQQKLGQMQKETAASLQEKQKEAMAEALKRARISNEIKLREDLKAARIHAQAEVQAQMQQLTRQIQNLEQQYQKVNQQQKQEQLKLRQAQEEKIKTEARLRTEEQIQSQLQQQTLKQMSDIKTEISQEAAPQLSKLKQQLSEQERILKAAQEQRLTFEKQKEQIQRQTQEQEARLAKLKTQKPGAEPLPAPAPIPPTISARPESKFSVPIIPPKPAAPTAPVLPPKPILGQTTESVPPISPRPKPPAIRPQPPFTLPLTKTTITPKPQPIVKAQPLKTFFSIKKIAIALGSLLVISVIGFIIYWRFALKPTPPPPPLPTPKEPSVIIKVQKPTIPLASWQKILRTIVPSVIELPLKDIQLDIVNQVNAWLDQRIFYLDFTGQIDKTELSGVFILELTDKNETEKTLEKIKARQASPVFSENYHQYNIISCQNQKWAFVDLFNLHYLILSQDSQNLKTVLDSINQEELAFLESLEDKTNFWPGLCNTTTNACTSINIWLNPEIAATSLKPALNQIDLKIPLEVTAGLKNYFTMALLDEYASTSSTPLIRTAALFGFDDFDQVNQAMLAWEKTMSHEVAFLFWGLKPAPPTTLNFQGALYQNAIIRFLKMPDEGLGIYYGLTKSNLILTNSEKNVKLFIDYFNQ